MKKVLIIVGYYVPSVKGGGPIQSIKNLVENLKDKYDFYLLANDRDLGDDSPFKDIETDKWLEKDGIHIYYANVNSLRIRKLSTILRSANCEIVYLNSFFSFSLSIIPYFLTKINVVNFNRIIVATRGNFSDGALGQKSIKKKTYIGICKALKLYKNVIWHATSDFEKADIIRSIGENSDVFIANNLTKNYSTFTYNKQITKLSGTLKLVYIARIHPIKNLLQALEILRKIEGNIEFNIYGPIEDKPYWEKCQNTISQMRENVKVNYYGPINNEKVNDVYQKNHVAILLTLGENFGHSIAEALIGGCPVIISDKTPWKSLAKYNVGYDLPLNNEDSLIDALNHYIEMDHHDYKEYSMGAFEYARRNSNTEENINEYYKMFDSLN